MPQYRDPNDPHSAEDGHDEHDGRDSQFTPQDADSLDSRFGADDDGRVGAPHSQFDHADGAAEQDVVDVNDVGDVTASRQAAAKAKPPKKRLSVGVIAGALVLLGAFAYVVSLVWGAMSGAKPQTQQVVTQPEAPAAAAAAPLGGLAPSQPVAPVASAQPATAVAPVAASASAADGVSAVPVAPAGQAPAVPAEAPAMAAPTAPATAALQQEIARLRNEKLALESVLADQNSTLERVKKELKDGSLCAAAGFVPSTRAAAAPARNSVASGARHTAAAKSGKAPSQVKGKAASGAGAVVKDPGEMDGSLLLKAVSPPSGPNMRAWIMDGDRLLSVVVGDSVRGARVLSISSREVSTTQGVIRSVN